MTEKKESVIKVFGRKIRRIFRGKLESEKRLEELRKKYEGKIQGMSPGRIFITALLDFKRILLR